MRVFGQIVDSSNGKPIPYATVLVVDSAGNKSGLGTAADQFGRFDYDSTRINDYGYLQFSSVSYYPIMAQTGYFVNGNIIDLEPLPPDLAPVVYSAKKRNYLPIVLIFGLLAGAELLKK